jgi:hypothetical protein
MTGITEQMENECEGASTGFFLFFWRLHLSFRGQSHGSVSCDYYKPVLVKERLTSDPWSDRRLGSQQYTRASE